ncbi:MAG: DUF3311 domain-containing protein [Planctomycetota bacterium]
MAESQLMAESQSAPEQPRPPASGATSAPASNSKGPLVIGGLVLLLLILHQDNWLWDNNTLVFGFLPVGLFWHACISVAASATWFLATKIAWPVDEDSQLPPQEKA